MFSLKSIMAFTLFLLGLLMPLPPVHAEEMTLDQARQVLTQAGIQAIQRGDAAQAVTIADRLRQLDPKDEAGYRISVMAGWLIGDFHYIVATVQVAKSQGVESIFLYKYMTQALFFLGDLGSAMQGFKRIENIMNQEMQSRK
ncbi:MAG: hypothetical protein PHN49_07695 [Candidatus Omnitrophica bacterium]|nr:hypothetical protein [Candidatus Omnitrophota bacterium]